MSAPPLTPPEEAVKADEAQLPPRGSKSKDEEGNMPDEDDYAKLPRWRLGLVILSLWIGTLLVAIDTTIISVAIPRIVTHFKALDHVGWYGSAYLFAVTAFQPAFGSIFRLFDAKWTYLACMVVFEGRSVCYPLLQPCVLTNSAT